MYAKGQARRAAQLRHRGCMREPLRGATYSIACLGLSGSSYSDTRTAEARVAQAPAKRHVQGLGGSCRAGALTLDQRVDGASLLQVLPKGFLLRLRHGCRLPGQAAIVILVSRSC